MKEELRRLFKSHTQNPIIPASRKNPDTSMSNTWRLSLPVKDVPGVWHFPWMLREGFQRWCVALHLHLHHHLWDFSGQVQRSTERSACSLSSNSLRSSKRKHVFPNPPKNQEQRKKKKKEHIWEAVGTVTTAPEVRQASTIFTSFFFLYDV